MHRAAILSALPLMAAAVFAADAPEPAYKADVKPASDEAQRVMAKFRVPAGLKVDLWAAEPLLANPVAFALDEKGRCYVAETFRHSQGVPDIRGHMAWLDDDLACRTVADRLALYKKHLGDRFDTYAKHHDRVRLVVDKDGDGKADTATVFAEGFNSHVSGIGAGLLARRGNVWYTCIPDLWVLRDTKGTGTADVRKSLSTGYGVHTGFIGHDLHGLIMGPDGKLYFSVGDRGANVTGVDGVKALNPDSGAVFRCNPDGTQLELFAKGLRNPQELAFNEFGDLFTCDNNSDGGDKARWVHIVEGGDSGWRIGYQFITQPVARGPWNAEKLWHPAPANTGMAIIPPLFNIADGPSGLIYDPGTGLTDAVRGSFLLCDFRGTSGNSGVRAIKLKPKGASYELEESKEFFWSVLATDCEVGPDGNLYVSDWSEGWSLPGKGRIYRVADPAFQGSAMQKEVQTLLAEGMDKRPIAELTNLLGHADQRVRQEAQFALAAKGKEAVDAVKGVARNGPNRLARIHAIWALGQMLRSKLFATRDLALLLTDPNDPEIRAQTARIVGDARESRELWGALCTLLDDAESRVRFHAAIAMSKGQPLFEMHEIALAVEQVSRMLVENDDRDPYLRHAGVMALIRPSLFTLMIERETYARLPRSLRLALAIAAGNVGYDGDQIELFLNDKDPGIVLEAARAIDVKPTPFDDAKLAALITKLIRPPLPDPLGLRVLVANYRLGSSANALAVVKFATRTDVSEALRFEALDLLGHWSKPSGRDRITGLWRPLPERPASVAADALKSVLPELLQGPDVVRVQAAVLCGKLGLSDAGPALSDLFSNKSLSPNARAEALKSLAALRSAGWVGTVERAVADPVPEVRLAALEVAGRMSPEAAVQILAAATERGTIREQQVAVTALGNVRGPAADPVLGRILDQLLTGKVPPDVQLDVLTAAGKRRTADFRDKLAKYETARPKSDPLAEWRETLAGGDAERGKAIFLDKQEVACQRCHKVGTDGGEVGPNLSDLGKRQNREYILEALVLPNKQIAKGFDTAVVTMTNGKTYAGVVKSETATELVIMTAEGVTLHLPKDQIDTRDRGDSAMPADVMKHITKSDLRDLVEYLAGQKAEVK